MSNVFGASRFSAEAPSEQLADNDDYNPGKETVKAEKCQEYESQYYVGGGEAEGDRAKGETAAAKELGQQSEDNRGDDYDGCLGESLDGSKNNTRWTKMVTWK